MAQKRRSCFILHLLIPAFIGLYSYSFGKFPSFWKQFGEWWTALWMPASDFSRWHHQLLVSLISKQMPSCKIKYLNAQCFLIKHRKSWTSVPSTEQLCHKGTKSWLTWNSHQLIGKNSSLTNIVCQSRTEPGQVILTWLWLYRFPLIIASLHILSIQEKSLNGSLVMNEGYCSQAHSVA